MGASKQDREEDYTKSTRSKIKFAPLVVPRHRRLQTLAVFGWTIALPFSLGLFFLLCSIPLLWPIIIPYLIWILAIDQASVKGGRASKRIRGSRFWVWFVGFFPVSLIKTADLPPDRKYVFGYHPHGIIGMGAIANFGTEATGFSKLFPGLNPHLLTLASNFQIPLYRDFILSLGVCSVSMKSCQNILKQGPGSSLTIVVGGAAESLSARPGTADLTLKRRMGFIKLAMRQGADLVPVFSFGENDIFEQLSNERGTRLYKLQKRFQAAFGFTLPIFFGRGLFNYNVGILPYRHPIVSVVGRPIRVRQVDNPTMSQMEEVQAQYIVELKRIWDEYKDLHAQGRTRELTIIA
ncbi:diacylglycerol acyltransferase [Leucosporidium creatinivorum]|uniref:Diacylglycerol O-acyltransferase n=1 Tax=Leucosporidium creatinivorum TaxID=106004 RepID=A0A1Y2ECG6_9BASI|nr:diacylglycerol acyltransferase [Leucosporidium creatinivorum]